MEDSAKIGTCVEHSRNNKYFKDNILLSVAKVVFGLALLIIARMIFARGAGSSMNIAAIGIFIIGLFFAPAGLFFMFSTIRLWIR